MCEGVGGMGARALLGECCCGFGAEALLGTGSVMLLGVGAHAGTGSVFGRRWGRCLDLGAESLDRPLDVGFVEGLSYL